MQRVWSSDSVAMAWHVRNVLAQHGIDSVVRNDRLYALVGEMPINECLPEVWVNTHQARRAEQLIQSMGKVDAGGEPDWVCGGCGETVAGSFAICWNCQQSSDGQPGDGAHG